MSSAATIGRAASGGEVMALPLWINGHAYITLPGQFHDVRDERAGQGGDILRRVPLCGIDEALAAMRAAQQAVDGWRAAGVVQRAATLAGLGESLAAYREHFATLLAAESGASSTSAAAEVAQAAALLQGGGLAPAPEDAPGVVAVLGKPEQPLLGPLFVAAPLLAAGVCIVLKPAAQTASVAVALAELATRCGMPDGVFNVVHGDTTMVEALRAAGIADLREGSV